MSCLAGSRGDVVSLADDLLRHAHSEIERLAADLARVTAERDALGAEFASVTATLDAIDKERSFVHQLLLAATRLLSPDQWNEFQRRRGEIVKRGNAAKAAS